MKKCLMTVLMVIFAISAFAQKHWTFNAHDYANTMTVVGVIHINNAEIPRQTMEIGAFCGTECRGAAMLQYYPQVERCIAFLSVSGEDGDAIGFRLYDEETTTELQATAEGITFEADAMLGRAGDPYVFDFSDTEDEVPVLTEITVEEGATGRVEGSGSYLYGEECTLTAVADTGSWFVNWTERIDRAFTVVSDDPVYTFVVTGKRDLVANFTAMTEQELTLNSGWNWVSSYLECNDDVFGTLKDGIAANNTSAMIKDMSFTTMLQNGSWSESDLSFTNESMYMINLRNATALTLTGPRASASSHPVTLRSGWNWIGFPSSAPLPVEEALSSITPNNGDIIKNMSGASSYTGDSWQGSLDTLNPGDGYMYYNKGSESLTLVYPDPVPMVEGTVEIPEGMDATQIIVTNFSEEVVPDEEGNFEIGFGNMLMAEDLQSGEVIYISVVSVDYEGLGRRRGDMMGSVALDAKETAIALALQVLPFGMSQSKDETFNSIKEVLYSLDCVKNLESAIETVVAQYGYLNMEELGTALLGVSDFFMEELFPEGVGDQGAAGNIPVVGTIELGRDGQPRLNQPYFPVSRYRGIRLDLMGANYNVSSDTWSLNMTAYSDNGIYIGIIKGYLAENGDIFVGEEKPRYFVPPMNVGKFMSTFVTWSGLKAYFQDLKRLITEEGFGFDDSTWDMASLEDIRIDIGADDNVLLFLSPWDDLRTAIVNIAYAVLGGINCWVSTEGVMEYFLDLFMDEDFLLLFANNWDQGTEGFKVIGTRIIEKFDDFMMSHTYQLIARKANIEKALEKTMSLVNFGTFVVCTSAALNLYETFGLEIVAEFSDDVVLPGLITNSFEVLSSTEATVTGALINEGDEGIVERGICYSASPNPTINDHCVPAEGTGIGAFTCTLQGLEVGHKYYVRSYAKNNFGMAGYGNELDFTTFYAVPLITTYPVNQEDITANSAVLRAKVEGVAPSSVWMRGFFYSTSPQVYYEDPDVLSVDAMGGGTGEFTATVTGLEEGETYYYVPYIVSDQEEVYHGPEMSFTTSSGGNTGSPSEGALPGTFTVNGNGDQVSFSQGNLQYQASTNTWRFAENQWDYVGDANSNISETYDGWIDLFGWGTSGYNHGANCYQPWSNSNNPGDYYAYGAYNNNLYDQTGQADWGYNAISNGGNSENNGWRTLTKPEWDFVFNTRSTVSDIRYAKACVNNINGVILLPDTWNPAIYSLNNTNESGASYSTNSLSGEQWSVLEQAGAVFLPAAGGRDDSSVSYAGNNGFYWSASYCDFGAPYVYYAYFADDYLWARLYTIRPAGWSVRLVRPALNGFVINVTSFPAEGGTVSGGGTYAFGEECTLTATPIAGYTFSHWTEDGVTVATFSPYYSFTVTGNRTLVANFVLSGGNLSSPSEGALPGAFTVNENGDQVVFSQGNLQYQASTNTWRLAENQWDYVGDANSNISETYDGWIDLFGWGTSGYNHGANCYQPWSTSTSYRDYYAYGQYNYNLYYQTGQADWGYNAISNGGNTENSGWRTLTHEEWAYLFNTRSTATGIRYARANVNNVIGVILLPDTWNPDIYSLNNTNESGASYSTNSLSGEQWSVLEQAGAVFLPTAGMREGISVYSVGSYGCYWSASGVNGDDSWNVNFVDSNLDTDGMGDRYRGLSVRLVRSNQSYQ